MGCSKNLRARNENIQSKTALPTPREIKKKLPRSEKVKETVTEGRNAVEAILDLTDDRLLLILGPCSIHDLDASYEYAKKLKELSEKVKDKFLILMRTYFVKPRTIVGWKGYINDPDLDNSYHIDKGLLNAREFLIKVSELGLPVGTEVLDAIVPQYIDDLISWSCIGARTTESQLHRELASGLSTPVGFKNATDGSLDAAINSLMSAKEPHHFLGISEDGISHIYHTTGNKYVHVVLRGGNRPNYDTVSIQECEFRLKKVGLPLNIVVDCSHGNSYKNHNLQSVAFNDCISQIFKGRNSIKGLMLESNLEGGNQKISSELKYGVSITDACIDWEETNSLVLDAYKILKNR